MIRDCVFFVKIKSICQVVKISPPKEKLSSELPDHFLESFSFGGEHFYHLQTDLVLTKNTIPDHFLESFSFGGEHFYHLQMDLVLTKNTKSRIIFLRVSPLGENIFTTSPANRFHYQDTRSRSGAWSPGSVMPQRQREPRAVCV